MLTKQEVFDLAAAHLLKQNKKAEYRHGMCQYRGPDNTMCAVGALIPDAEYRDSMEDNDVDDLFEKFGDVMKSSGLDQDEHSPLLGALQEVHDYSEVEDWPDELLLVARAYELSAEVLG